MANAELAALREENARLKERLHVRTHQQRIVNDQLRAHVAALERESGMADAGAIHELRWVFRHGDKFLQVGRRAPGGAVQWMDVPEVHGVSKVSDLETSGEKPQP